MKINVLDLEFSNDHFYIQKHSIVEKVTFNNRTFYSKFEKQTSPLSPKQLQEHHSHQISLAVSLVENNLINYIVIEYRQSNWESFYSLLKHLLKSLNIEHFQAYYEPKNNLFQLFIFKKNMLLDSAYKEVDNIRHLIQLKSEKSYKIYPNKNLPKNFNIITLPTQKI